MPRAAVIREGGSVELVEVPMPEPGEGEVRLRLEGSGVCGSDLPVWAGRPWFDYPQPPGAPGHEGWGMVHAVGPGVTGFSEGDRVAGLTFRAYADYDIVRAADLVPLPAETGPFPGEALGCAVNVLKRSGIREGDTVAVVGAGFLGCVIVQLAAAAGARVLAVSRRRSALETAGAMGATATIALEEPVTERVEGLTDGDLCDVVIEAAGVQATLDAAAPLTRTRGRLVIAGFHQDGSRQVDMQLWNWRGLDVVNAHERDPRVYVKGIREAAAAVAEGRLDPTPLYTHRFGLDQVDAALDAAAERPDGFIKALVLA
ncbi:MAG TPA: zinc-binding dehydrogenase [Solirubrobacterales bacterium]